MGTYNIVTVPVACRVCGLVSAHDLQLHYGAKAGTGCCGARATACT
jgi:hypothetical protein